MTSHASFSEYSSEEGSEILTSPQDPGGSFASARSFCTYFNPSLSCCSWRSIRETGPPLLDHWAAEGSLISIWKSRHQKRVTFDIYHISQPSSLSPGTDNHHRPFGLMSITILIAIHLAVQFSSCPVLHLKDNAASCQLCFQYDWSRRGDDASYSKDSGRDLGSHLPIAKRGTDSLP